MELLKNAGTYRILTPHADLRGQLLRIELAGRTCYQSFRGPITPETADRFIRMLLSKRPPHESVIEHSLLTVVFSNVSRGFTHELVRHRLAAYSQASTRYVDYARGEPTPDLERFQLGCVAPPHRDEHEMVELGDGSWTSLAEMLAQIEMFYRGLRQAGWPPEDARQVLPIGTRAEIVHSANFRQWRHEFKMRTAKPAHWEIRVVMGSLLRELQGIIPVIFEDFEEAGVDANGIPYFTFAGMQ